MIALYFQYKTLKLKKNGEMYILWEKPVARNFSWSIGDERVAYGSQRLPQKHPSEIHIDEKASGCSQHGKNQTEIESHSNTISVKNEICSKGKNRVEKHEYQTGQVDFE